jgi:hypothetical protein
MADLNFAERVGLDFLRGRIEREDSHIHRWSRAELSEIRGIERRTIAVAALAGAFSGSLLAAAEMWLSGAMIEGAEAAHWREQLPYWSIYLALALVVSGAEILYLYWYVLRVVARIGSTTGLRLSTEEIEHVIALGLLRAGLELPNPRAPIYGIDPYARVPRWKLIAYAVLYRIKIGATSFVLRVLLRRLLARAALRFFIPLAAIPVYAIWNGVIAGWVMREVRIRVAGPVAVQELSEQVAAGRADLSDGARRLILETVGESVLRGEDAHPNYMLLLTHLFRDLAVVPESIRINWKSSRAGLKDLNAKERDMLLATLTAVTLVSSRIRRAQRDLLAEVQTLSGRPFRPDALQELRREFVDGQGLGENRGDPGL